MYDRPVGKDSPYSLDEARDQAGSCCGDESIEVNSASFAVSYCLYAHRTSGSRTGQGDSRQSR